MISRPMAFASEISEPTSRPSHTSAHCAELVRRGSITKSFAPLRNALQNVMEKNRVRLARVRAPQKDHVRLFNFAVRTGAASRSEYRRQTGDAGGVSSAVAAIDVVAADHRAHELLRDVIQLVGGLRATEHAERPRPVPRDFAAECLRRRDRALHPKSRDDAYRFHGLMEW